MEDFLNSILLKERTIETGGVTKRFTWQYLAEGILECIPHDNYTSSIVISAGIHGNETAPIEILGQIVNDLFSEKLVLKEHALFILGNPQAIREGKRYVDHDLNRLFCGGWRNAIESHEATRAKEIEMITAKFFENSESEACKYHYDLHTAIKPSLIATFALLPFQSKSHSERLLRNLDSAELDGLVFHTISGKTFTNYTTEKFDAASATLELGKANPFGENDLKSFSAINDVIRKILNQSELGDRKKPLIQKFRVIESIVKHDDSFHLNVEANIPNFTLVEKGNLIAFDKERKYEFLDKEVYLIFINSKVATGLRAGLILEKI